MIQKKRLPVKYQLLEFLCSPMGCRETPVEEGVVWFRYGKNRLLNQRIARIEITTARLKLCMTCSLLLCML